MALAVGAIWRRQAGQLVERAFNAARRTIHREATKPNGHDVLEAGVPIGEAREELTDRKGGRRGGRLAHAFCLGPSATWVKGINAKKNLI